MVAELLQRAAESPRHVFVCGSNAFVEAAASALIANRIPASAIRTERYGA
jgi:ferredoxin-NADP reductase